MKASLTDRGSLKGSYVMRVLDGATGGVLSEIRADNLIVRGTGYGYDILTRQLGGDVTYSVAVDSAQIGTGTNVPAAADTALQTPVTTGIGLVAAEYPAAGQVVLSFFITDASLPNGTYKEFGIFCDGRLFARSLISPNLVKGSNQNVTCEYTLTFS